MWFYLFLDYFFTYFHACFTLFNSIAWIWKKTRKLNLIFLLIVSFSWFILGIWYGFGYCIFTDWHWQVKRILGQTDLPRSYIKYLVDYFTGLDFDAQLVDSVVIIIFIIAITASISLNLKDLIIYIRKK